MVLGKMMVYLQPLFGDGHSYSEIIVGISSEQMLVILWLRVFLGQSQFFTTELLNVPFLLHHNSFLIPQ